MFYLNKLSVMSLVIATLLISCNKTNSSSVSIQDGVVKADTDSSIKLKSQANDSSTQIPKQEEQTIDGEQSLQVFQGDMGDEQLRLFLDNDDMQFVFEKTERKQNDINRQALYGSWQEIEGKQKIELNFANPKQSYILTKQSNNLIFPFQSQSEPTSQKKDTVLLLNRPDLFEYTDAPMKFEGMYFYMGNVALFNDCATGKQTLVDLSPILEKSYDKVVVDKKNNQWVHLIMQAHFTMLPSADDSRGLVKHLVLDDENVEFDAKKKCAFTENKIHQPKPVAQ